MRKTILFSLALLVYLFTMTPGISAEPRSADPGVIPAVFSTPYPQGIEIAEMNELPPREIETIVSPHTPAQTLVTLSKHEDYRIASTAKLMKSLLDSGASPAVASELTRLSFQEVFGKLSQRYLTGKRLLAIICSDSLDKDFLACLAAADFHHYSAAGNAAGLMLNLVNSGVNHQAAARITRLSFVSGFNDGNSSTAENELLNIIVNPATQKEVLEALKKKASHTIREAADMMIALKESGVNSTIAATIITLSNGAKYGPETENRSAAQLLSIVTDPATDNRLLKVLGQKSATVKADAQRMLMSKNSGIDPALAARVVTLLNRSLHSSSSEEYIQTIDGLLSIMNDPQTPDTVLKVISQSDTYRVRQQAAEILNRRNQR